MQRRFIQGVFVVLVAVASTQAATAAVGTKTVEQTIPASGHVKIANLAGRVVLNPAGSGPVKVVAVLLVLTVVNLSIIFGGLPVWVKWMIAALAAVGVSVIVFVMPTIPRDRGQGTGDRSQE